jgi:hypothetical protein
MTSMRARGVAGGFQVLLHRFFIEVFGRPFDDLQGVLGALPSTTWMAPSAQEGTQTPQPSHFSSSIWMIFRVIFIFPPQKKFSPQRSQRTPRILKAEKELRIHLGAFSSYYFSLRTLRSLRLNYFSA